MSEQDELLVISLWQPWATWVMWGWKSIETRRHARFRMLAGHRIGIHAAKRWDTDALRLATPYLTDWQLCRTMSYEHARGALICTAYVGQYSARLLTRDEAAALIECATVRTGISLQAIQIFQTPIPMRGRQGIWRVPFPLVANRSGSTLL